jgi:transposase
MSTPEQEAEMVRLYFAEHWRVGTIASQLGAHPDVVRRVLGLGNGGCGESGIVRARMVDPYRDFIAETLARYPRLRSTRLYDMIRERGYGGAVRTLRRFVATTRPQPRREVYLRTETLPGEQAQVDWAYVGKIPVPGGERALWLFVLVLSSSRALWGEFVLDLTVHSLCRSLVRAARFFGGTTRQWLFDNPKIVVLERQGDAVRFHPVLLDLCAQMRVQPRLCAVARPEHKGKVERTIRYLRDRFLAGRSIAGVTEGNAALLRFVADIADLRPHPVLAPRTVSDILGEERPRLLARPELLPETDLVIPTSVDRQAFVRFDTNRYSVPSRYAERTLSLVVDDRCVRVLDGADVVASFERCYGKRQVIERPEHRAEILRERRAARDLKGRDRLRAVVPEFGVLLERWVDDGPSLAIQVTRSIQLLDLYGEEIFSAAVRELVERGLRDTGALAVACDRLRRERHRPVPIDVPLPSHVGDCDVVPHDLGSYDEED